MRALPAGEARELAAQLAVLNSVQAGLASQSDLDAIIRLVGDKLYEIFRVSTVQIGIYDRSAALAHTPYCFEDGNRHVHPPRPLEALDRRLIDTQEPVVVNEDMLGFLRAQGLPTTPHAGKMPRSSALVPMLVKGSVSGYVSLQDNDHEHTFTQPLLRLATTLANSMGVALENARLFDELQSSNRHLAEALEQQTATSDVLRALSGSQTDLKSLLETIALNAAKVCGADDAHIYRVEGETLKEWTHRGPIPGLEDGEWLPLNRGSMIGRAVLDQKTIHIRDAAVDLDEQEYPVSTALQRRWGTHTNLGVPLLRDGKSIGGIAIRRREIRPFTESEIAQLRTFAEQAVIAIENTRLFDETRQLLKETEHRNAELAIINGVQAGLASQLDIQGIYELVGEKIREIFNAQVVLVASYEADGTRLIGRYLLEKGRRFYPNPAGSELTSFHRHLIREGRTLLFNQQANEELERLGAGTIPGTEPVRSAVFVPLLVSGRPLGVISLQHVDRDNAFSDTDVRLLETVANSMSVALENARLFDETQRLLKETEQRARSWP